MRLLAWDTSSKAAALVALEGDSGLPAISARKVAEWSLDVDAGHSERLLWAIDGLLASARWRIEEVDAFGVGVGPGSFTGLRIGLTTARTLAQTLGKPLVGVSSLAALAHPLAGLYAESKSPVLVVAATDACKGELFALWGEAPLTTVEEQVLEADALIPLLQKRLGKKGRWIVVGEARTRYASIWAELPQENRLEAPLPFLDRVQGWSVGALAWEAHRAGLGRPALEIQPRYLRASDAELKLRAGLLPPGPTRGTEGKS
jgi:tRNA threonylcarbamoyladenosine biosynthesis protein TsaB